MENQESPDQINIDLEQTRLLAMSNNVRLRMEQDEADQIQQQLAEPTGKDIYE